MLVYIWYNGQDKLAYKVKDGTKFNHYVLIGEAGVRVVKLDKVDSKERVAVDTVDIHPAQRYLNMGASLGITKSAKDYLESELNK